MRRMINAISRWTARSTHSSSTTSGAWQERPAACRPVGAELTPDTMLLLMLKSEECWQRVQSFITHVMRTKDLDGHSGGERIG